MWTHVVAAAPRVYSQDAAVIQQHAGFGLPEYERRRWLEPGRTPVRGTKETKIGEVDPMGIRPKPLNFKEINHRIVRLIIITALTVFSVAGCGDDEGSEVTAPDQATSAPTGGDNTGTMIDVDERDFTIELSTTEFVPGTYTFVATNNGQTTHALQIEGQGLEEETEDIAPGDSTSLTVTLEAGEYELYCPVGNHKDMGMELDIAVE